MKFQGYILKTKEVAVPVLSELNNNEALYFATRGFRELYSREDSTRKALLECIAEPLSMCMGIPIVDMESILFDINPLVIRNINPGPKLMHIVPNSLPRVFQAINQYLTQ